MLSIILSTFNGMDRLPILFDSFCRQDGLSTLDFEFLVIDNASNDETRAIVDKYKLENSWIKYIKEERAGINYARNRGISESNGDILIFIDDDITFGRSWLVSYHDLFTSNIDAILAGGRVSCVLPNQSDLPEWLDTEGQFSFPYITFSIELGDSGKTIPLNTGTMPVGPNMAFRRVVFDKYGMFRVDLGLKGKSLMPGAEFEFYDRMKLEDIEWFYVPKAHVYHPLKNTQLNKEYFLKRTFGVGRVAAKTMQIPINCKKIGPVPIFSFRLLLEKIYKYIVSLGSGNPKQVFYCRAQVYKIIGLIYEWINPREN